MILGRIPCNPFKSVDTAQADRQLVAAELLDSAGKAFGDLSFLGNLDVPPRCSGTAPREVQPDKDHHPTDDLGEGPPGFVLKLKPLLDGEPLRRDLPLRNLPQGQDGHSENNKASNEF